MLTGNDWSDDRQGRRLPAQGRREHEPERRRHRAAVLLDHRHSARRRPRVHRQGQSPARRKVAIINETMAKYYYGDGQPDWPPHRLRRRQAPPTSRSSASSATSATQQLRDAPSRFLYIPYAQDDSVDAAHLLRARRRRSVGRRRRGAPGRAAARSQPADRRHEDHGGAGRRVAVRGADGGGAVGGVRGAGDAAGRASASTA